MADNNLQGLMGVSMEKIKEMVDVNTVVGDPIQTPDGTVLIPVSKISMALPPAGRTFPQNPGRAVRRRSGAGINITPHRLYRGERRRRSGCFPSFPSRIRGIRW